VAETLESVVAAKRRPGGSAEVSQAHHEENGRPRIVVTDGLCSYPTAMKEIGSADRQEVGRRRAERIRISLFDDENGPCSGFEVRRRCRKLPWPSGAPLRRRSPIALFDKMTTPFGVALGPSII
jgi:hypothetical protein